MNTIDLHVHTNYSDGGCSPEVVLRKAEAAGVKILSITDHEGVRFYTEWMKRNDVKKYFSGRIIPGVEISTIINGTAIELLGYNINPEIVEEELKKYGMTFLELWRNQFSKILEAFNRNGFDVSINDFSNNNATDLSVGTIINKILSNPKFDNHPKRQLLLENKLMFYRNFITNTQSKFFADLESTVLKPEKVCEIIKKAGGQIFIPHPGVYANYMEIFNYAVRNLPIDGIECFHPKMTKEQWAFFEKYAKTNGYLISGGSDYHFDKRFLIGSIDFDTKLVEGVVNPK